MLRKVIRQKIAGNETTIPEPEKRPPVRDLVTALQASLRSGPRPLAKLEGRRAQKMRPRRATGGQRKAA